jgi:hypothetical protein
MICGRWMRMHWQPVTLPCWAWLSGHCRERAHHTGSERADQPLVVQTLGSYCVHQYQTGLNPDVQILWWNTNLATMASSAVGVLLGCTTQAARACGRQNERQLWRRMPLQRGRTWSRGTWHQEHVACSTCLVRRYARVCGERRRWLAGCQLARGSLNRSAVPCSCVGTSL